MEWNWWYLIPIFGIILPNLLVLVEHVSSLYLGYEGFFKTYETQLFNKIIVYFFTIAFLIAIPGLAWLFYKDSIWDHADCREIKFNSYFCELLLENKEKVSELLYLSPVFLLLVVFLFN